jgi:hypothetical protein
MNKKFTIRGKTYDLEDAADLVSVQNALSPENWPGKRADAVRLFLALQSMLAHQLSRHFAANFKKLASTAIEEGADGGAQKIGATFTFEIDFTSPLVAAITKLKMGYSVRHGTEGKPQTHDLTQGELPLDIDDMSQVLNPKSLAEEAAAVEEEEAKEKAAVLPIETPPDAGEVTPENTPGDPPPPAARRRHRKKD